MRLLNIFSRKKKVVSSNWVENGYLLLEKLMKGTEAKDIRSILKIINSGEYQIFDRDMAETIQVVLEKVDSGEKKYSKILEISEEFTGWDRVPEAKRWKLGAHPGKQNILEILREQGKRFQDWKELKSELESIKIFLLGLIAEEKRLGIKLHELSNR
ncbi:hypothetical protein HON71_05170 [Candidatus Woesearchaeota archaeon]|jgi:hypothetical protein|nr:hypothetical protein [Candidatus Woesearchaeota archaeon]MBT5342090.1 hypothetical protein [Candidatus Woesearchaeota archaeon]MBT6773949.1 hypothetical protein [Candidatus Woesearchaeota archaeon]